MTTHATLCAAAPSQMLVRLRSGAYVDAEYGHLAPPPERPGTPVRAVDTIDCLQQPWSPLAPAPTPEPPLVGRDRRVAQARLAGFGLCLGASAGAWIGYLPAVAMRTAGYSIAPGAVPAYGLTVLACASTAYLSLAMDERLTSSRIGDAAALVGLVAGIGMEFAFYAYFR